MSPDFEKRIRFSGGVRKEIKDEQDDCCQICGERGHLTIHHKKPIVQGGCGDKTNGVGLCRGEDTKNCHDIADTLTIRYGVPFEQIMEQGIEYWIDLYDIPR